MVMLTTNPYFDSVYFFMILVYVLFFLIHSWISLHSQTRHIDYYNITSLHYSIITTWSVRSEEIHTAIMETLNRVERTEHTITL